MTPGDLDIAARTVWAEARGHSFEAMRNVARVMVNRVLARHRRESTLSGVCTEPSQFSCWNADDPNLPKLLAVGMTDKQFRLALRAVLEAVDMKAEDDVTRGALHYLTPAVHLRTWWARDKTPVHKDDAHLFFTNID